MMFVYVYLGQSGSFFTSVEPGQLMMTDFGGILSEVTSFFKPLFSNDITLIGTVCPS
jgi:hypothetical protein